MPINVQKKGWEDILRKQCIVKINADPDQIDISSDDNDLEDDDHIEAIEEENRQMSFAAALQMLDQLNCFFYSLHLILPQLLMDKSHKSKNNVWRSKDLSAGLRSYENRETFSRRAPV